ncbi:hypothetical protein Cgig2_013867 [Carnegiea gigantea]|uniref:3,4-dihydroxy-2-butanone 4-phosphate synthase n=1 Tax=Carnegiea gigantea TaxID=171969 RepID=A0A9Q1KKQ4_9CARY|nr:hypothetical protein Cgig2_013867 [Carnegiea gigantea]
MHFSLIWINLLKVLLQSLKLLRENEGDMVMAAELATLEAMAFFVKYGTGIVCFSMKDEDLERLQLPLMVASKDNEEKLSTAFTFTVVCFSAHLMLRVINSYENVQDAKNGTTRGVSVHDRATTMRALASMDSKPGDFNCPGHIFTLKYMEGGVLKRAGSTLNLSVLLPKKSVLVCVGVMEVVLPVEEGASSRAKEPQVG